MSKPSKTIHQSCARSAAALKAWETRRANEMIAAYKRGEFEGQSLGPPIKSESSPSALLLIQADEAIRLGWTFIFSKSEDGYIQGGATLPLCNGDAAVTDIVSVEDDWNESSSKRILAALLEQIDLYHTEENT